MLRAGTEREEYRKMADHTTASRIEPEVEIPTSEEFLHRLSGLAEPLFRHALSERSHKRQNLVMITAAILLLIVFGAVTIGEASGAGLKVTLTDWGQQIARWLLAISCTYMLAMFWLSVSEDVQQSQYSILEALEKLRSLNDEYRLFFASKDRQLSDYQAELNQRQQEHAEKWKEFIAARTKRQSEYEKLLAKERNALADGDDKEIRAVWDEIVRHREQTEEILKPYVDWIRKINLGGQAEAILHASLEAGKNFDLALERIKILNRAYRQHERIQWIIVWAEVGFTTALATVAIAVAFV
jgi:hypothetical protein